MGCRYPILTIIGRHHKQLKNPFGHSCSGGGTDSLGGICGFFRNGTSKGFACLGMWSDLFCVIITTQLIVIVNGVLLVSGSPASGHPPTLVPLLRLSGVRGKYSNEGLVQVKSRDEDFVWS
jgi:hypothetical protein